MGNRRQQAPSNSHEYSTATHQHAAARAAMASVLDTFYLQGRVMSEAEYAPYRDAMRGAHHLATQAVAERRHHQTARILPMRRQTDRNAHVRRCQHIVSGINEQRFGKFCGP
jgi:hypothetical protein